MTGERDSQLDHRHYHAFRAQGRRLLLSLAQSQPLELHDETLFHVLRTYETLAADDQRSLQDIVRERRLDATHEEQVLSALGQLAPYLKTPAEQERYVPEALTGPVPRIQALTLLVAETCNFRCKYCYTGLQKNSNHPRLMSPQTAQQAVELIVKNFSDHGALMLNFFGGEPLLNLPVIRSTIEYARRRARDLGVEARFCMTTNGWLLDEATIRFLHQNQVGILISLDGPREVHDRYRVLSDGSGTHQRVEHQARLLRQITGQLSIRATMGADGPPADELRKYFAELGANGQVMLVPAMTTGVNNAGGEFTTSSVLYEMAWRDEEAAYQQCYRAQQSGEAFAAQRLGAFELLTTGSG